MERCYDPSGDVLNDGTNQYLYDGEGRICAVASTPVAGISTYTGYIYDADGTRVAKGRITAWSCDPAVNGFQTTSDYILGPSGEQVTEMAMDANNSMAWQHTNVYAAGKLLATYDNNGLHFYLNDPLGTRRAQTDYAGVLEQTCSSLPFGDALNCSGGNQNAPTEHHFTGKERDTESGNDYFGARYYASLMGRFMSPDWAAAPMPVPFAKLENPQTLNLYQYVGNNPLTGIDPDGHMCVASDPVIIPGTPNGMSGGEQRTISCDTPAEWDCFSQGANCNKAHIRPVPGYSESGNNLWRTANDALIIQAVDFYNDAHGYGSGDSGYLTPELVKAWMMEESGGTQSAFLRDPMQVNNPGDWTDLKSEMGLSKGEAMTRGISIAAGLGWLEYKGTPGRMDKFGEYIYTGPYRGDRNALTNYNGNTKIYPQDGGVQHRYAYSNTILNNAAQMSQ
jgi:RHS repeat-associated protein